MPAAHLHVRGPRMARLRDERNGRLPFARGSPEAPQPCGLRRGAMSRRARCSAHRRWPITPPRPKELEDHPIVGENRHAEAESAAPKANARETLPREARRAGPDRLLNPSIPRGRRASRTASSLRSRIRQPGRPRGAGPGCCALADHRCLMSRWRFQATVVAPCAGLYPRATA